MWILGSLWIVAVLAHRVTISQGEQVTVRSRNRAWNSICVANVKRLVTSLSETQDVWRKRGAEISAVGSDIWESGAHPPHSTYEHRDHDFSVNSSEPSSHLQHWLLSWRKKKATLFLGLGLQLLVPDKWCLAGPHHKMNLHQIGATPGWGKTPSGHLIF